MFKISSIVDRLPLNLGNKNQANSAESTPSNIVFIDARVDNFQSLLSGLKPNTEAVILDPSQDGIEQITDFLKTRTGAIDSIQILSHGSTGNLQIGSTQLNANNLEQYQQSLQSWFSPLPNKRPDLLIYGCDVASGEQGTQFINKLSQITGADVAASTDLTGSASKGGNWILEKATGIIESGQAFSQKVQNAYQDVLTTPSRRNTNDDDSTNLSTRSLSFNSESTTSSFTEMRVVSSSSFTSVNRQFFTVGNNAPVLNPLLVPAKNIQASVDIGLSVSSLATKAIIDIDVKRKKGIAITNISNAEGTWQYSLDGGAKWLNIGFVSSNNALLLDANNKIRFVPNINSSSLKSFSASSFFVKNISFCAWDQTGGVAGTFADTNFKGSFSAFSNQLATTSIVVNPTSLLTTPPTTIAAGSIWSEFLSLQSKSTTTSTTSSTSSTSTTTSSGSSSSGSSSGSSSTSGVVVGGIFFEDDDKDKKDKDKKGKKDKKDKKDKDDDDDLKIGSDKEKKEKKDKKDKDNLLGDLDYDSKGYNFFLGNLTIGSGSSSSLDSTTTSTTTSTTSTSVSETSMTQLSLNSVTENIEGTSADGLLVATATSNTIYGGSGSEIIFGFLGSRNNLLGGEGNDLIFGQGGRDFIRCGEDNDIAYGGKGKDVIFGEQGNDIIYAGKGNDSLFGGTGNDILFGQKGDDFISGGTGRDRLLGGDGNDTLEGNESNDLLLGGKGKDKINGGTGDDICVGGAGDDTVTGGAGNDRFRLAPGTGTDTITDFAMGEDTIELVRGLKFTDLQITQGVGAVVIGLQPGTLFPSDKPLALVVGVSATSLTASSFVVV